MSTIWGFGLVENKHTLFQGKDCMKKFCDSLKKRTKTIIFFEKKKMLPLTKGELKSYQEVKVCYICGRGVLEKFAKDENYRKVRDHWHYTGKYRGAAHSICNLKFNVPDEIPVVFHRASNYDYHFIIKELANESEGECECLGEKQRKVQNFFSSSKNENCKNWKVMKALELYFTK